jgi:hypothetical protein
MHDDLITFHKAPPKRAAHCHEGIEHHLTEGAVMLAFAMHLLRTVSGIEEIAIHPDGEHGKRFDFEGWFRKNGFTKMASAGKTSYGGSYRSAAGATLIVHPASGLGDVAATCRDGHTWIAECKGGIVNTRHAGQVSKLRKGLCEAVGLSLARPVEARTRQFAVVPHTRATEALARRMAARALAAGIGIALVDERGRITEISEQAARTVLAPSSPAVRRCRRGSSGRSPDALQGY